MAQITTAAVVQQVQQLTQHNMTVLNQSPESALNNAVQNADTLIGHAVTLAARYSADPLIVFNGINQMTFREIFVNGEAFDSAAGSAMNQMESCIQKAILISQKHGIGK